MKIIINRLRNRYTTAITNITEAYEERERRFRELEPHNGSPFYDDGIVKAKKTYDDTLAAARQKFLEYFDSELAADIEKVKARETTFEPTAPTEEENRLLAGVQLMPKTEFTPENIAKIKSQLRSDVTLAAFKELLNKHEISETGKKPSEVLRAVATNCIQNVKNYEGYKSFEFGKVFTRRAVEFGSDEAEFCRWRNDGSFSDGDAAFALSRSYNE